MLADSLRFQKPTNAKLQNVGSNFKDIRLTKEISKLTIELDGIGHAISDNKLSVPLYQRSYPWEETHVSDLYDDLFTSIRNSEDEYFIGSVVISSGKERDEVVDGQQRLATIAILLSSIRDHFYSIDGKESNRHSK